MGLGQAGFQSCSGLCLETRRVEEENKKENTRSTQVREVKFIFVRNLAHRLGDK